MIASLNENMSLNLIYMPCKVCGELTAFPFTHCPDPKKTTATEKPWLRKVLDDAKKAHEERPEWAKTS